MRPFVATDLSDRIFEEIVDELRRQCGFDLGSYKDGCIRRRVAARIRACGLDDAEAYLNLLRRPGEAMRLVQSVTIHVSHFFRNPTTFAFLEEEIIPELLAEKRELLFWSVGCSTGEEPYSLSILARETWPRESIRILATDISRRVLDQAEQGWFDPSRLQEVPAGVLRRNFIEVGDGHTVVPEVKKGVSFQVQDIRKIEEFPCADLILCRNVLIYFSKEEQTRIIRGFAEALNQGGYLVLGRAETLPADCRSRFQVVSPSERVYRKSDIAFVQYA